MSTPSRNIAYYEISRLIYKWIRYDGESGCKVVNGARLAMDKLPPMPERPKAPPIRRQPTTFFDDLDKIAGAYSRFKVWLDTPDPPKAAKRPSPPQSEAETIPPFDIQEIPAAMRKVNIPVGARLMERWFAGELNYSPNDMAERAELNQHGQPYPPSMIDKTNISMKWALGFVRAKEQYDELIKDAIYSDKSLEALRQILRRYPRGATVLNATEMYDGNIELIHRNLQFQHVKVDSSFTQKLTQALNRSVADRGIPDDLTAALGSFSFYVAIERAWVDRYTAKVSAISVYIKDNYTFNTAPGIASQYLGHWSSKGIIAVPLSEAGNFLNLEWANFPVSLGNPRKKGNTYFPIRNSDFRKWQTRHNRGGDFIIYSDRHILPLLLNPIEIRL
jgi:hypothetical protein